ncbi:uncharacterized protein LOC117170217 [Belonocnema kinseyi]|uniref:uncharacterized protein LOC117170217 n=1 Tax=Belonocnema kinseyi TaxID=2817044 RepID=UPI00143DF00F|nr:uncharacterized protein LOC117170217 [Belonocnema kinseyi]
MPFSVIELKDGVVLVPTKRIRNIEREKMICYWPPYKSQSEINDAVSKLGDPLPSWTRHDVLKHLKKTSTVPKKQRSLENGLSSLAYQDRNSGLTYEELSFRKMNEIIVHLRDLKLQSQNNSAIVFGYRIKMLRTMRSELWDQGGFPKPTTDWSGRKIRREQINRTMKWRTSLLWKQMKMRVNI